MPPKILLLGQSHLSRQNLSNTLLSFFEFIDLPMDFPVDYLDYLGNFSLIVINHDPQNAEDGLGKIAHIRNSQLTGAPQIPILLIASQQETSKVLSIFREEFFDFLLWPFEEEVLLQRLENHMGNTVPASTVQAKKTSTFFDIFSPIKTSASLGIVPATFLQAQKDSEVLDQGLKLQYFGVFTLFYKGKQLVCDLPRKPKLLLAYLLFHYRRPVHRDQIVDWLWPDVDGDSARNSLNNAICHIRRWIKGAGLQGNILTFKDNLYSINKQLEIHSDTIAFSQLLQEAQTKTSHSDQAADYYHRAFAYYRGRFLEEWMDDSWVQRESERFREKYLLAIDKLSASYFGEEAYEQAISITQKVLEVEPLHEEAHRRLMQCYLQLGYRDKALRQFEKCKTSLYQHLNIGPGIQTLRLLEEIQRN